MKRFLATYWLLVLWAAFIVSGCAAQAQTGAPLVTLLKTPNNGIQPQAMMDANGTLHLIYFSGQAAAGDIFYVRSTDNGQSFSTPLRVNSQPNSAIATGTIRGAQLALGKNHRVHVAWNGSGAATKGAGGTPMLYARLNDAGTAFEPQRNVMTFAGNLDGGGTIAADGKGDVYVAWHGNPRGDGEAHRAVYLARSRDDGQTFAPETAINPQPTGACGCCQMRAFIDKSGALYVLYRAAGENVNRDSTLLVSNDHGAKFQSATLDKWKLLSCPMSSYTLSQNGANLNAAWENDGQIFHTLIQPNTTRFNALMAAPANGKNRKHPTVISNAIGQTLLAWTEGTGWNKGGSLAWQVFDASGKPTDEIGHAEGVPVWGLLSAIALTDSSFLLFY